MKQVFQADDGTIFEKEMDCEKYEARLDYKNTLGKVVAEPSMYNTVEFMFILEDLVERGHAGKLINFIKSIGEQDANN